MRAHFRSRDKDGGNTIREPHATCKLHGCVFYKTGVIDSKDCGNGDFFTFFAPVTLTLAPWPLYELDPYSTEIYRMCKYEWMNEMNESAVI